MLTELGQRDHEVRGTAGPFERLDDDNDNELGLRDAISELFRQTTEQT